MKKSILIVVGLGFFLCFTPVTALADTSNNTSTVSPVPEKLPTIPPDTWIMQPLVGLGTGLATNAAVMMVADLISVTIVQWVFYLPMGISLGEGTYLSSHYSTLASAALLYPFTVFMGIQAYGELIGFRGSALSLLFAYTGGAIGTTLYFLGYREIGLSTMIALPVAGAFTGFLISRSPVEKQTNIHRWPDFKLIRYARHLFYNFAGAAVGDILYLAAKLEVPVLLNDTGNIFYETSSLFRGNPLEWLVLVPTAVSAGVTFVEKTEGRPGSPLLTFGASFLASATGWGISAILGTDSAIPAHLLAITASAITSFIIQRER